VQVAAGATVFYESYLASAAFGYAPISRLELLVNVERNHLPFRFDRYENGVSMTRGGTMTFVSGEVRGALFPPDRVSPFVLVGAGRGMARPTVNTHFPDPVTNDLRVAYVGAGVRVPLRRGFTMVADARGMLGVEGNDGLVAAVPVRVGVAWRF